MSMLAILNIIWPGTGQIVELVELDGFYTVAEWPDSNSAAHGCSNHIVCNMVRETVMLHLLYGVQTGKVWKEERYLCDCYAKSCKHD